MGCCDTATFAATVCPATLQDTAQLEWGGGCQDLRCAGAQPVQPCPFLMPSVGLMGPNSCPSCSHTCSVPPALGCHHAVGKPTGGKSKSWGQLGGGAWYSPAPWGVIAPLHPQGQCTPYAGPAWAPH